jgi:hypothetical protein
MVQLGLYYPYVHFRDDDWLKVAALYWPQLARLAAPGLARHDTAVARELADTLDFVFDINPTAAAAAVGVTFVDLVREHGAALRGAYHVAEGDLIGGAEETERNGRLRYGQSWEPLAISTPLRPPNPAAGTPPGRPRTLAGLHREHLSAGLADALVEEGLAVPVGDERAWLGVAPELGWIYTCALAEECARQNPVVVPTTDQIGAHVASGLWRPDHLAAALFDEVDTSAATPVDAQLVALTAVRIVVPANLAAVPVSKIVELRRQSGDDLTAFRDLVAAVADDLGRELAEVRDPDVFRRYLDAEVERRLVAPLNTLKDALRAARIEGAFGVLHTKIELPGLLTSATGTGLLATTAGLDLVAQAPIAAASGAMAFWVLSAWRTARGRRAEVLTGPAAYLLRLERGLDPRSLVDRVGGSVRRLNRVRT